MKKYTLTIIVALFVGVGAFYGGTMYGKTATGTQGGVQGFQRGAGRNGGFGGANANGGFAVGQIISKDNQSITLQLVNNSSTKIIFFSASTPIMKTVSGTVSDLQTGTNVSVMGTANSDGSITAESIQLRNGAFGGRGSPNGGN